MRRDVFQAIADPVRREIILKLSKGERTINAIAQDFEISRPAISKHIRILEECNLLAIRNEGRERWCSVKAEALIPAFLWIDQYRFMWEDRMDRFEKYVLSKKERR